MDTEIEKNSFEWDEESPAELKLQSLQKLFPEFFFDGHFVPNEFKLFLDSLPENKISDATYGLNWFGKEDAIKILRKQSEGALAPVKQTSFNFDDGSNVIITGENLEVMKLIQKSYFGAFKMIYMDPPYNTGDDFIFEDDIDSNLERYIQYVKSLKNENALETISFSRSKHTHSNWLSMMFPRLFMARNLLAADGVIFVSIDDHESHYLRILMDEIFGAENFVCTFVWEKRYAPAPDAKDVAYVHENILCYRRSDMFQAGILPMTEDQVSRYKNPDSDPRGPWKSADYTCRFSATERPTLYYPIINPNTGEEVYPKKTRVWACSQEEHQKNVAENRIWWPSTASVPAKKSFLSDIKQGGMPSTILKYEAVGHTDEATKELRKWFPGIKVPSKPTKLMQHLIRIADIKSGDLILDCFAGTGTMAEAVLNMNEQEKMGANFVLIQFPEVLSNESYSTVSDLAIKRATECAKSFESEGRQGIRCFELTESAFKIPSFRKPADEDELIKQLTLFVDNIRDGKSKEEILFEVMLKNGMKLTEKTECKENMGVQYFSVNGGQFIACLDNTISEEFIDWLIQEKPKQVICLDMAFMGNDKLKTNALLKMRSQGIKFSTI